MSKHHFTFKILASGEVMGEGKFFIETSFPAQAIKLAFDMECALNSASIPYRFHLEAKDAERARRAR